MHVLTDALTPVVVCGGVVRARCAGQLMFELRFDATTVRPWTTGNEEKVCDVLQGDGAARGYNALARMGTKSHIRGWARELCVKV